MNPNIEKQTHSNQGRTNQEWLSLLRGEKGDTKRRNAHEELCAYLFTTAINYLWTRQSTIFRLAQSPSEEMAPLAEDFVQQFCCKLVKDEYELLNRYDARGRFLAWSAQVLRNLISDELRKRDWRQTERLEEHTLWSKMSNQANRAGCPEVAIQSALFYGLIEAVLSHVSSRNQAVFFRYVVDGERADVVAAELGMSVNGIYSAAHRTKAMVRRALVNEGYA